MHARPWHTFTTDESISALDANPDGGLSTAQAELRLLEEGRNVLIASRGASPLALLFAQFKNVLIVILLLGAGLSLSLGHEIEAISIGVIVLFSALLGFVQEYRAERAIELLQKLSAPVATVLRDGEERDIPAEELVPGDIVLLEAGDKVPADARVITAMQLNVDESPLTGESVPVSKATGILKDENLPVGDKKNMVFAGTSVTQGRGTAVVALTGMKTEFGTIAGLLGTVKSGPTPLQKNLDRIGHMLALAAVCIIAFIVALGLARGENVVELVIFGIALAVAVVPEALPAVVTISLAVGVQRMVKRHALVRKLPTVETLGSTTVICTDKTGTLTKNEMTVRRIVTGEGSYDVTGAGYKPQGLFQQDGKGVGPSTTLLELLKAATLSSDAHLVEKDGAWTVKGDPTEGALVVAAAKAGIAKHDLDAAQPRVSEIAFTSESKRMTTIHATDGGTVAYAKGAPEVILDACTHELTGNGPAKLTDARREALAQEARGMAAMALRVLGIARKDDSAERDAETGMTFLGLAGMIDPPRQEAKEAIARCHNAGIRVAMITGDHPVTAEAIARELGLLRKGRVVTGAELDAMNDDTLRKDVHAIDVFARVSPSHKLRVVGLLQDLGEITAMTGDGVNDAPALKKADIGIAMGITGTDVSKEAASMTLTDDNFASIVAAVEEGRGIFDNIRKYLLYLLSSNVAEILAIGAASAIGLPSPLTAVQILYINLVTDGLPAMALSVEAPEKDLMRRSPRDPRASVFNRAFLTLMTASSTWAAVRVLAVYSWALYTGRAVDTAMTMAFFTLMFGEFAESFVFRSLLQPTWKGLLANKWLLLAIGVQLPLIPLMYAVPVFRQALGLATLTPYDWLEVTVSALLTVVVMDTVKWILRRLQGKAGWKI
jgi:Ca2+-transporting ATPase